MVRRKCSRITMVGDVFERDTMIKKFNLDSTFFKVLMWCNNRSERFYRNRSWDTCSFTRHVLWSFLFWGISKVAFYIAIGCVLSTLIIGGGMAVWRIGDDVTLGLLEWWWWPVFFVSGLGLFASVIGVTTGAIMLFHWFHEQFTSHMGHRVSKAWQKPKKEDEPVTTLYSSWKNKICSKIEFTYDN